MEQQLRSIKELAVRFVFSGLFALLAVYALGDFGSLLTGMIYGAGAMFLAAIAATFRQSKKAAQQQPTQAQRPNQEEAQPAQASTLASW